jgi:putative aldouronate transport system substrate-binding protein
MSCDIFEDNVTKGHNSSIMFNEKIMEDLGITQEDVQTESGFYAACEKVKNSGYTVDGQSVIPVVLHGNLWISSSLDGIISETFGVIPVDADGNYMHREMNPGYKNALKFVNTLIRNEYLDVNTLTLDENANLSYVESGRVFCWIGNPAQTSKKAELSLTSFGPILADSGAVPAVGINMLAGTGWIQTFISKDCANPEALAKALSFATSEEGLWLNYYGVEGEDYTVQADGTMVRTQEGLERYENDYNSNIWLWPINDTDFYWNTTPGPEEGTEEYVYGIINAAIGKYKDTYLYDSCLLSFVGTSVIEPSSDLGIKSSQITNYLESQKAKIVSAATEEEFEKEYQNMIDTLNSYDVTAVDEELNKTLQENYKLYGEKIENPNASIYAAN